jgi:hypothetical protein
MTILRACRAAAGETIQGNLYRILNFEAKPWRCGAQKVLAGLSPAPLAVPDSSAMRQALS